jgi:hypothetical protein
MLEEYHGENGHSILDDVKIDNFIIHRKSIKDIKNQIQNFNVITCKEQDEKEQ